LIAPSVFSNVYSLLFMVCTSFSWIITQNWQNQSIISSVTEFSSDAFPLSVMIENSMLKSQSSNKKSVDWLIIVTWTIMPLQLG